MNKLLKQLVFLSLCTVLIGCSNPIWIYKVDVQQGNLISERDTVKLKKGMTMAEVRQIMGEPVAVDTFNTQRWNYIYTLQLNGGKIKKRSLTIIFKNDRVWRILDAGLSDRPAKGGKSQPGRQGAKRKTA